MHQIVVLVCLEVVIQRFGCIPFQVTDITSQAHIETAVIVLTFQVLHGIVNPGVCTPYKAGDHLNAYAVLLDALADRNQFSFCAFFPQLRRQFIPDHVFRCQRVDLLFRVEFRRFHGLYARCVNAPCRAGIHIDFHLHAPCRFSIFMGHFQCALVCPVITAGAGNYVVNLEAHRFSQFQQVIHHCFHSCAACSLFGNKAFRKLICVSLRPFAEEVKQKFLFNITGEFRICIGIFHCSILPGIHSRSFDFRHLCFGIFADARVQFHIAVNTQCTGTPFVITNGPYH